MGEGEATSPAGAPPPGPPLKGVRGFVGRSQATESDEAWRTYEPGLGNQKNSDRFTLFERSCFGRSPSKSASCQGEDCRDIIHLGGYTWVGLSKIEAADCVPSPSACDGTQAMPGGLVFVVTRKCHEMVFVGQVLFLEGPKGERAVMHATPDGKGPPGN